MKDFSDLIANASGSIHSEASVSDLREVLLYYFNPNIRGPHLETALSSRYPYLRLSEYCVADLVSKLVIMVQKYVSRENSITPARGYDVPPLNELNAALKSLIAESSTRMRTMEVAPITGILSGALDVVDKWDPVRSPEPTRATHRQSECQVIKEFAKCLGSLHHLWLYHPHMRFSHVATDRILTCVISLGESLGLEPVYPLLTDFAPQIDLETGAILRFDLIGIAFNNVASEVKRPLTGLFSTPGALAYESNMLMLDVELLRDFACILLATRDIVVANPGQVKNLKNRFKNLAGQEICQGKGIKCDPPPLSQALVRALKTAITVIRQSEWRTANLEPEVRNGLSLLKVVELLMEGMIITRKKMTPDYIPGRTGTVKPALIMGQKLTELKNDLMM